MSKPTILLDMLAFSDQDGGFTSASRDLLQACARLDGYRFVVVHHERWKSEFSTAGVEALAVSFPFSLRFGINTFLLRGIVKRVQPSAVHCEISAPPPFLSIPTSMTLHDLDFLTNSKANKPTWGGVLMSVYWRNYYIWRLKRATSIKAISTTTANDLARALNRTDRVTVVYPYFKQFQTSRKEKAVIDELRIAFVGSLVPRKNLSLLLRSLLLLRRPWTLDLIGGLWWGADVMKLVEGDSRVNVHGFVTNERRDELLSNADVLVLPSKAEGFGYPPLEAAARGVPSLVSDIEIFREVAPEESLFDISSERPLADRLESLDTVAMRQLSLRWAQSIQRFTFEKSIEAHNNYFKRLCTPARSI